VRKEFRDLADPAEAHALLGELDLGGGTETVPLTEARGRVLAERVDAEIDVPGFDRAAVDGYAVRAAETFGASEGEPIGLDVAGRIDAGEEPGVTVEEGTAAEIATGAVVPPGADAVVMVERTARTDDEVRVRSAVTPGEGVMVAGADVAAGERALGPGARLTPREVALLSAIGVDAVPVRRAPRVGIVSTGDELVRPGGDVESEAGQIYDVNSHAIRASVEEAGGDPVVYPHVGDDPAAIEAVLTDAARECDLVLSSGSTSAGRGDVVYRIVADEGELLLHGVAVKPGKPMLVGRLGDAAYVGLPGYPVSAGMIFHVFVAPAIRNAAGRTEDRTATTTGRMARTERYREGRLRFLPVGLLEDGDGDLLVYPVDKGSGATTSLVDADGFVEMPAGTEQFDAGESVRVTLFSPDIEPPALLGAGEDDPLLSRLLDRLDRPRYLPLGSREGLRRLRDGVPDVAVTAGPTRRSVESVPLGGWSREWGLVVPAGNPEDVSGVADLLDRDLVLVNRERSSGLRASFEATLDDLAEDRGVTVGDVTGAIDGFELTARAHESPPRRVLAGKADAGIGLRATAAKLDLGFVPVGTQAVRVLAAPDRAEKPAVRELAERLPPADGLSAGLAGFQASE